MPLIRATRSLAVAVFVMSSLLAAHPLVAGDAGGKNAKAGKILADNGFRPKPNGFGFENWGGNQYPYSDLTADDAAVLFGDRVCARFEGQTCVPTPATKTWLKEMNQMMKGGHCEGMAAMSAAFFMKAEKLAEYGGQATIALSPKDQELMRTISAYFVTQALEPVKSATNKTRKWTLQAIVDYLVKTIASRKDYPTLGIYGKDGGHAITPYLVELRGDKLYRIYVYDNNYPGAENFVDIDVKRDRWVYAGAALNPSEPPQPWEGGTGAMDITLLSVRYEPLECPFCGNHKPPKRPKAPAASPSGPKSPPRKPGATPNDYSIFTPSRCSQVQATSKKDKKKLSMGKNGVQSQIDGATMLPLRGARGCFVQVPFGMEYDFVLIDDGLPSYSTTTEIVVFSSTSVYSVENLTVSSQYSQSFSFSQSSFSFEAGGTQQPTIIVAGEAAGASGYYEIDGFSLSNDHHFTAEMGADGQFIFAEDDPNVDSWDIHAEAVSETETEVFEFDDVVAGENGQVIMNIEADGDLELDIDSDSDGQPNDFDADDDNDGTADAKDTDDDGDGVADTAEAADEDGDSIPDSVDTDDDNDGDLDTVDADDATEDPGDEDTDHDGVIDSADADDDNDGTVDAEDTDDDGDGTADSDDPDAEAMDADDTDNDGVIDEADLDDDNDGKPDSVDADDDGDGVNDDTEVDTDGDGVDDTLDADDDGDGSPDAVDADDDGDGSPDTAEIDTDHDGVDDSMDADDDGDGQLDMVDADEDGDGVTDDAEVDSDDDGVDDSVDADDDGDGTPDTADADDDGDGQADSAEADSDSDGVDDSMDADDDGDGTPDTADADDDGDGTPDTADADDGGDSAESDDTGADEPDGVEDAAGDDGAGDDGDGGGDDGGGDDGGGDDGDVVA